MFEDVKVGDEVTRMLAGLVPMKLRVTEIKDNVIVCGDWTFDRETGMEIDDYFAGVIVSFLVRTDKKESV